MQNGGTFATDYYDYDSRGNLQDTYRGSEDGGRGERFTYSTNNQLTHVAYGALGVTSSSPTSSARNVDYALDAINRKSPLLNVTYNLTTGAETSRTNTNFAANDLNQYYSVGGQALSYDFNFNLTGYNGWTYAYDAQNRMISASGPNSQSAQFTYDGLGRCVRRVINNVTTLLAYDGWKPIVETDASGNVTATNIYGNGPDEILSRTSTANGTLYYKSDAMGNVRFVLNGSGALVEKYTYDAFGAPTVMNASGTVLSGGTAIGNRFLFKGREYLATMGIYDNRKRMYHPGLGVFMQTDPKGFSGDPSNLYRYGNHNPMLGGDPMGEEWNLFDMNSWTFDWGGDLYSGYGDSSYQTSYATFSGEFPYSYYDRGAYEEETQPYVDNRASAGGVMGTVNKVANVVTHSALAETIVPGQAAWNRFVDSGGQDGWAGAQAGAEMVLSVATMGGGGMIASTGRRAVASTAGTAATAAEDVTYLYQKVGAEGQHLKFGITRNPAARYTSEQLAGGKLNILTGGSRIDMLQLERTLHGTLPLGPEERQLFYIKQQMSKGLAPPPY